MRHQFKIASSGRVRTVSDTTVLGVYAILRITPHEVPGSSPRMLAAKFLRQNGGMDMDDACAITDFVSQHAALDKSGDVKMTEVKPQVEYSTI